MPSPLTHVHAISLFVEDLAAAKSFYSTVFAARLVHEDETSAAFKFENVIINLLRVENAHEIVAPGTVAPPKSGSRFQISMWVPDIDAVCAQLKERGVTLLAGPIDRPWGMRTAHFVDPAGHSWEIGQRVMLK